MRKYCLDTRLKVIVSYFGLHIISQSLKSTEFKNKTLKTTYIQQFIMLFLIKSNFPISIVSTVSQGALSVYFIVKCLTNDGIHLVLVKQLLPLFSSFNLNAETMLSANVKLGRFHTVLHNVKLGRFHTVLHNVKLGASHCAPQC